MKGQFMPPGTGGGLTGKWLIQECVTDNWSPGKVYSNSGEYFTFEPPVVPGYSVFCIVGYEVSNATASGKRCSYCMQYSMFYDPTDNRIKMGYRDTGGEKTAKLKVTYKLLYMKD